MALSCPPSCANNQLVALLDRYCSDKGTIFQSRHHYGSAYHSIFGSLQNSVTSLLEIGIGDDTAPSIATWLEYFPRAQIYALDVKSKKNFEKHHLPGECVSQAALISKTSFRRWLSCGCLGQLAAAMRCA